MLTVLPQIEDRIERRRQPLYSMWYDKVHVSSIPSWHHHSTPYHPHCTLSPLHTSLCSPVTRNDLFCRLQDTMRFYYFNAIQRISVWTLPNNYVYKDPGLGLRWIESRGALLSVWHKLPFVHASGVCYGSSAVVP